MIVDDDVYELSEADIVSDNSQAEPVEVLTEADTLDAHFEAIATEIAEISGK